MERVAVTRQCADLEAARLDGTTEPGESGLVGEQLGRTAMGVARIVACSDLDAIQSGLDRAVERGLERLAREQDGEDAELHRAPSAAISDWR